MRPMFTKRFYLLICAFCYMAGLHAATITSTAAGGNWNATTSWVGSILPAAGDDVVIANGATITVTASPGLNFNSITVGQGVSGILQFGPGTTAFALTVTGNIVIANGAILRSNTVNPGSATVHSINIGGSFANAGSFNALASANSRIHLNFTGNGSFTNAGAVQTSISTIAVNAGAANTLDFNPSTTLTLPVTGFLTITTGTFKLNGNLAISHPVFAIAGYSIPLNSGFWLNNPNAVITGQAGSTGALGGTLRISSGTYNIGTGVNNSMAWSANAIILIEGGIVNVQGKFGVSAAGNTINYTQTGGTITVGIAAGSNLAALASFDAGTSIGSNFTMSGGSIITARSAGTNTEYRGPAAGATVNITNGILQLGNSTTAAASTFKIAGAAPNIILDNSSLQNPAVTQTADVGVWGDMSLDGSGTYSKGAFALNMRGASASNPGNITVNGSNTLTLNASATVTTALSFSSSFGNQTFSLGSGNITASELPSLTINNSFTAGTVTLPTGLSMLSGSTLTLTNGAAYAGTGGTGSIGLGTAAAGTFTCVRTLGFLTAASSSFGAGVTTKTYTYNGAATQTTGAELTTAASASIHVLTITNAALNLTLNTALTVNTTLNLTNGIVYTNAANTLQLGTAAVAGTLAGGSATSFIEGPFIRTFAASRVAVGTYTNVTLFPVGKNGNYLPIYTDPSSSAGGAVQILSEAFDNNTGTNISPLGTVSNFYWNIMAVNSSSGNLANGTFMRIAHAAVLNSNTILEAATASGTYSAITPITAKAAGLVYASPTGLPAAELNASNYYSFGDGCTPLPTLPGPANICVGYTSQLYALTSALTNATGTWTSSAPGIATVDASGNITALSAGSVTISLILNSADACFGVPVLKPITITSCIAVPGTANNLISWYKADAGLNAAATTWNDQIGSNNLTRTGVAVTVI